MSETTVQKLLYNVREVAQMSSMSPGYIWERVYSGEIPSVKVGAARRITAEGLRRWLDSLSAAA